MNFLYILRYIIIKASNRVEFNFLGKVVFLIFLKNLMVVLGNYYYSSILRIFFNYIVVYVWF